MGHGREMARGREGGDPTGWKKLCGETGRPSRGKPKRGLAAGMTGDRERAQDEKSMGGVQTQEKMEEMVDT